MAYIRALTKLPSGIDGWYIYYDENGKMYISSPNPCIHNYQSALHTKEDLIVLRDILNECIKDMEKAPIIKKHEHDDVFKTGCGCIFCNVCDFVEECKGHTKTDTDNFLAKEES